MTRETVEAKAARYLAESRLVVTRVVGNTVTASCDGETGAYDLGHTPGRGWWCTCPVRTDRCCHLAALWLVAIRRRGDRAAGDTMTSPAEPQGPGEHPGPSGRTPRDPTNIERNRGSRKNGRRAR